MESNDIGLYSVTEACRYLGGIGRGTIYELINSGKLASIKHGARRLFTKKQLDDYVSLLEKTA